MSDKTKVKVKIKGPITHPAIKGLLGAIHMGSPKIKPKIKTDKPDADDAPQPGS